MNDQHFTTFQTPIGYCGIAWSAEPNPRISRFLLPAANQDLTRRKLSRGPNCKEAEPPAEVIKLIERVREHLEGKLDSFEDIPLDLSATDEFAQVVYVFSRTIKPGATRTYGEIASAIGKPGTAQAVGQALGANPIALIVPCHRVLGAGGKTGGFSAPGGIDTKFKLLKIEGAVLF